jgi:hypothetical protein
VRAVNCHLVKQEEQCLLHRLLLVEHLALQLCDK